MTFGWFTLIIDALSIFEYLCAYIYVCVCLFLRMN